MSTSYADLATIRNSSAFQDRAAIAVAYYAQYIINEGPGVTDHNRRFNWASNAILNPSGVVAQLGNIIVLNSVFTALNGSDISTVTDAQLQAAVEAAINGTLLAY